MRQVCSTADSQVKPRARSRPSRASSHRRASSPASVTSASPSASVIEWIHQQRRAPRDLGQRRPRGSDHGHTVRHGFEHRHSETFIERRNAKMLACAYNASSAPPSKRSPARRYRRAARFPPPRAALSAARRSLRPTPRAPAATRRAIAQTPSPAARRFSAFESRRRTETSFSRGASVASSGICTP